MNYDAVNIGLNDLAAGIGFLKNIGFLPLIGANFYDHTGKTVFSPYTIKRFETLKIGIIGLSPAPSRIEKEYVYRSWREILPVLVPEIAEKADCIILLSSLQEAENEEIARLYPSIRLIFSAISRSGNTVPKIINKAIFTQTGNRGRYLGQLHLTNPGQHDWINSTSQSAEQLKKRKRAIEYRLKRLDLVIKQNEQKPTTLETLGKQKTALEKQLKHLESQSYTKIEAVRSTYKASFMPLSRNISGDREIDMLVNNTQKKIQSFKNDSSDN
jgi:2',3'-cyclic-nucleotide 2'-phosphodiesterase (5'-nucleotidase family)